MSAKTPPEKSSSLSSKIDDEKSTQSVPAPDADETPQTTAIDRTEFLEGFKLFLVLTGISLVVTLAMLDLSIIGTAIPQITSDFNRLEDIGWYIGAYQLASATIQPLSGKLFTYFSSKWTFLFFFLIFEIGSVVCGAATSSSMLIAGRSVAGVGASGLVNGAMTIVMGACKPEDRPLYTGLVMGVGQIGIVAGPLLGGVFTEHASWRWCFYVNLPLGGVAGLFMVLINIPEQTPKEPVSLHFLRFLLPRFDLTGFALFAPASIMFLLALQLGSEDHGWNSSEVIGLLCGAGVTAVVFVFWERRMGENAMIPLSIIGQKIVWSSALNFAFLMTSVIVGSNFIPIFLQSVKGLSPTMSGVYMLATIVPQFLMILISGALVSKLGYYIPWALLAAAGTTVGTGLVTTWDQSSKLGELLGYQVLLGFRGAGLQMGIIAIQTTLPPSQSAVGTSILVFAQNFFGAVFITIANTVFQETLTREISSIPGGSPEAAIAAGGSAEAVRALAPSGPIRDGILQAYSEAFGNVMFLIIATCGVAFFVAFGMGWVNLRTKPQAPKGEA